MIHRRALPDAKIRDRLTQRIIVRRIIVRRI